ncbi:MULTISPECIES: tripartite tricarboxylate transporter TctB family protein [unclassified Herbaspirillum]|uniref:tripartite tricarboxylate transporter TctB family protein n=1 Tax=unclassified Herbaspirillum TaxID=2624150 RepID=UPI00114F7D5F|nr:MULTISPECIES: tripartite tricarboxylate transporter TctB family protein [unclassified Herbaspirillum]MBB5391871.1 putative tricarboxylic transport membrane protein [Herbaspirillum sp. SJZ102]TQK13331.1 putative tricarboxylic transport membrane protein [Herbaspirillum sp. SJZ130]TQK15335.1 putative tricarboxylic transport membrane protein [Herbaspirillum sp. SJZ106]TWC71233.1 putative tricarboxylic transport membrane protein [Herbaspirillum sp. SJZ099]
MKINDALSGLLVAFFAVAIYVSSAALPAMGQDIGPNVFPQALAGGFMICAVLLIIRGLRGLKKTAASHASLIAAVGSDDQDAHWFTVPEWVRSRRAVFAFLLVPAALLFYIWVSEPLGFLPTAFVLLMVLFLTFRTRIAVAIPVALASALGIHYVFYKLLKVPLPWGVLKPIAW